MLTSRRDDEFRTYVLASRSGLLRTATLLSGGDRHQAEDLVQTTLTRLYLAWPRVRKADGADGYARRTLVNALIDERRRPFRRREQPRGQLPDEAAPAHASDIDFSPLHAALGQLSPGMRAAVVFRHVYEFSVADTAHALNCSEGNVKSQTARGLERLRTLLATPSSQPVEQPTTSLGSQS